MRTYSELNHSRGRWCSACCCRTVQLRRRSQRKSGCRSRPSRGGRGRWVTSLSCRTRTPYLEDVRIRVLVVFDAALTDHPRRRDLGRRRAPTCAPDPGARRGTVADRVRSGYQGGPEGYTLPPEHHDSFFFQIVDSDDLYEPVRKPFSLRTELMAQAQKDSVTVRSGSASPSSRGSTRSLAAGCTTATSPSTRSAG